MSLLSRHILRTLAAPFGWGVVALTGMLLLNALAQLIDALGGKGLAWQVMGEAVVLALPALMVLILPMAVLTATLYAYGQLAADMELVAMYATGVSVWRMARPALIGALGVAVVNFILFDQFVPRSNARYKALRLDVAQAHPTLSLKPKQLNSLPPTSYYLSADEIILADTVGKGDILRKVTVYNLGGMSGQQIIHADSGIMKMAPGGSDMFMTLYRGTIEEYPSATNDQFKRTSFLSDRFRLRQVTNPMQRSTDMIRGRGDRELSGCELLDGIVDQKWYMRDGSLQREVLTRRDLRRLAGLPASAPPSARLKPPTVKHCGIYRKGEEWLARQLLSPTALAEIVDDSIQAAQQEARRQADLAAIQASRAAPRDSAAAMALMHRDTTRTLPPGAPPSQMSGNLQIPLPGDSLRPLNATPRDTVLPRPAPIIEERSVTTTWNEVLSARLGTDNAKLQEASYAVEYHKKWAIPLSSFCFVLLGLALALKNPRGGIGLVIGGSLVIFMIFYVLIIGGENLAKKLYIDPVTAMYGPLLVFTLFGLLSVYSANREMGAARSSAIMDRVRSMSARIRRVFSRRRSTAS